MAIRARKVAPRPLSHRSLPVHRQRAYVPPYTIPHNVAQSKALQQWETRGWVDRTFNPHSSSSQHAGKNRLLAAVLGAAPMLQESGVMESNHPRLLAT